MKSHKKNKTKKKKSTIKLIYFYMKGCPYCIKFENIWLAVSKRLSNLKIKTQKINGPKNPSLLKKYNLNSFPSLVLVKNNIPIYFNNNRSVNNILNFVKYNTLNLPKKVHYFYMEGCPYCIKFEKVWSKLETYFHKKNIKTKKIDGPKNRLLAQKYNIKSYPTILIFRGLNHNHYIGKRTFKAITDYVNKM